MSSATRAPPEGRADGRSAKLCGATQKLQSVASLRPLFYSMRPTMGPTMRREPTSTSRTSAGRAKAVFAAAFFSVLALLPACGKKDEGGTKAAPPGLRGAAPPPVDSGTKPGACKDGGGEVKDPVSAAFFPRIAGAYCVNPDGETRAFGEKAPKTMEGMFALYDGGGAVYVTYGVKRMVTVDYVDGAGGPGIVSVVLSQFPSVESAYGLYANKLTSDGDPARPDMSRKTDIGQPAALGTGSLVATKGAYLLELAYVNTGESGDADKLRASADKILPSIARDIVSKLPGTYAPPSAVSKLPTEQQLPFGVTLTLQDALGAPGTGVAAVGYYQDGDKRYRVLSIVKADAEQAKDVLKSFARLKGATEEKNLAEGGVRLMAQDIKREGKEAVPFGPKGEWIVARQGAVLLAVGDEPFVLGPDASVEKVTLNKEDKLKKLRAILPTR